MTENISKVVYKINLYILEVCSITWEERLSFGHISHSVTKYIQTLESIEVVGVTEILIPVTMSVTDIVSVTKNRSEVLI